MYIVFVDFTKAFDTVNRDFLFKILGKLGCPPKFIRLIQSLYSEVNARLIVDGVLTEPFVLLGHHLQLLQYSDQQEKSMKAAIDFQTQGMIIRLEPDTGNTLKNTKSKKQILF